MVLELLANFVLLCDNTMSNTKLPEGTILPVGSHTVTIQQYLSAGGFADIYRVTMEPPEDAGDVACLKRVVVPDKSGLNQLRKEVDVMKVLRKARCIVRYYDSHAERLPDGRYQVLVLMELCPNKSLLDYMNDRIKTKLTEPQILSIMLDIGVGVWEMHRLKMIHRDIKIENVLIDARHRFKLADFGSTSAPIRPPQDQGEFQALSHDIMYQTTPQYRAPEMIDLYRGFPIDEKADIWALGCFLYKLCYYTTPFEANGDIAILHALFQFPPHPPFSGDLKNLIIIMLQENPIFRPNIVQVLMLVAAMMKLDFDTVGVDDFYQLGPYNFHALHEYQRHKQAEYLKQQQYYLSQHEERLSRHSQDSHRSQSRSQSRHASQSRANLVKSHQSVVEEPESDESFSQLEDLDNVEERYPSLDDLLEPKEDLVKKEAWEKKDHALDPSAQKLADDIFAKTPEPGELPETTTQAATQLSQHAQSIPVPPAQHQSQNQAAIQSSVQPVQVQPVQEQPAQPAQSVQAVSQSPPQTKVAIPPSEPTQAPPAAQAGAAPAPPSSVAAPEAIPVKAPPQSLPVQVSYSPEYQSPYQPVKHSNPWKEYTKSSQELHEEPAKPPPQSHKSAPNIQLPDLGDLSLDAKPEPNLIDLEVGLDSSSSGQSVTPLVVPKRDYEELSLVDLDLDAKPQYKKRILSIQNPQSLNFQEQVIDFASDDENPENSSEMNRLLIRNSLKKPKSRKSSEHKRTESTNSDKKRLSFFRE